jgi:recombination protein RecA
VGLGARLTNKLMRVSPKSQRRVEGERDCLCLIINQWRDRIGVTYGDPRTTPGGKGKNFSYFTRVEVVRDEWLNGPGKVKVGQVIKIRTMKNKTAPPLRTAVTDFYFDNLTPFHAGDYDTVSEVWNIATTYDIVARKGAWFYYGDQRWNGKDAVLASLREDLGLRAELDSQVRKLAMHGSPELVAPAPEPAAKPRRRVKKA